MSSVLIVDDEDVLLDLVASLIEDLGHRPLVATNGRDAIAMLDAERELPALVISDVMMPRMNGVALAQHLKRDPRYRLVPVILMSAAGRRHPDGIADSFISKPFDLDELEQLIQHYSRPDRRNGSRRI